jgi:hypothetical protein
MAKAAGLVAASDYRSPVTLIFGECLKKEAAQHPVHQLGSTSSRGWEFNSSAPKSAKF